MEDDDKQIGRNLTQLRGSMSRELLAAKMVDRGFKWSRATVFNIEDGKRSLKLKEASAVLECLGRDPALDLPELISDQQVASVKQNLRMLAFQADRLSEALALMPTLRAALKTKSSTLSASKKLSKELRKSVELALEATRLDTLVGATRRYLEMGSVLYDMPVADDSFDDVDDSDKSFDHLMKPREDGAVDAEQAAVKLSEFVDEYRDI